MVDQGSGLLKGEGFGGAAGLTGRGAAQQYNVAADLVPRGARSRFWGADQR